MSQFKISADEARELAKKAVPTELEYKKALEDSYLIIRGDAKKGQKTSVQKLFGDRQTFADKIMNDLQAQGFSVAHYKDDKATILSITWATF